MLYHSVALSRPWLVLSGVVHYICCWSHLWPAAVQRASLFLGPNIALPFQVDSLGLGGALLIVAGGILYSVGAMAYVLKWPDPAPRVFGYHEIFHVFVLAASALHFTAVSLLVHSVKFL